MNWINLHIRQTIYLFFFAGISFLSSCYPSQFLGEDEQLLYKSEINFDKKPVKDLDEVDNYVYQKPNRTIFAVIRFHIGVYAAFEMGTFKEDCSAEIDQLERDIVEYELRKQRGEKLLKVKMERMADNPKKWVKKELCRTRKWMMETIGEAPVILDYNKVYKSQKAIEGFLHNKGYLNASVDTSFSYQSRKRASVTYDIQLNQPYKIMNITRYANDEYLDSLIMLDSANIKLKEGVVFDLDDLKAERERLTKLFQDNGYYKFSKEYIVYKADTGFERGKPYVNLRLEVLKIKGEKREGEYFKQTEKDHQRYQIRRIYINPNYDLRASINTTGIVSDTIAYNDYYFIFQNDSNSAQLRDSAILLKTMPLKVDKLLKNIYITEPDNRIYKVNNVAQTYKHLNSLRIFRLNTVDFAPIPIKENLEQKFQDLDCYILLKPLINQAFTVELEGSNFSSNVGMAGNFIYEHRNVLKSATRFSMKLKGAREKRLDVLDDYTNSFNTQEYQTEFRFTFPQLSPNFVLRRRNEKINRIFNPKTTVSFSYLYRERPDYTMDNISFLYGYYWIKDEEITHFFNPFELSRVNLYNISDNFQEFLTNNPQLQASYEDHFIAETNYTIIYNPQNQRKLKSFPYIRFSVESAGNSLGLYNLLMGNESSEGGYKILNKTYSQFIKFDFDYRYFINLDKKNKLAFRSFTGVGYAYSNSISMPFGKRYYSGGANSLRAWQIRTLGPGANSDTLSVIPNQTGDLKLEWNVEYRSKLFWMIESAVFFDIGNIWNIYESEQVPMGVFKFNTFYKQLAVGTGVGLRLDFSFFIFRADLGIKLRDPASLNDYMWIFKRYQNFTKDDMNISLSIGYPF